MLTYDAIVQIKLHSMGNGSTVTSGVIGGYDNLGNFIIGESLGLVKVDIETSHPNEVSIMGNNNNTTIGHIKKEALINELVFINNIRLNVKIICDFKNNFLINSMILHV